LPPTRRTGAPRASAAADERQTGRTGTAHRWPRRAPRCVIPDSMTSLPPPRRPFEGPTLMPTHPTHPSHPSRTRPPRAPRLALVLGSGGVRSIAAIGLAEVLAREGVRPDLVVGCSSGALFAATIALGMAPEQALQTATELWSHELTRQHRWRGWLQ